MSAQSIDTTEVAHLAELTKLELSESETIEMAAAFGDILGYISTLSEEDIPAHSEEAGEVHTVLREDGTPHEGGLYTEALLKEAPKTRRGYVEVKKILSQD